MPWALFESDFCFEKKFNLTWKKKKKKKKISDYSTFQFLFNDSWNTMKTKNKTLKPSKAKHSLC